ncbi:hypothetical protein D3C75_580460 [compost metagenome]
MNRVEAQKNLKLLEQDKARLLSLNHLNSTWAFKNQCEMRVKQISEFINNIETGLKDGRTNRTSSGE